MGLERSRRQAAVSRGTEEVGGAADRDSAHVRLTPACAKKQWEHTSILASIHSFFSANLRARASVSVSARGTGSTIGFAGTGLPRTDAGWAAARTW